MLTTTITTVPLQTFKFTYTLKSKIRCYIYYLVIYIISYLFSVITIASFLSYLETSLVAQMVKHLPTMQENQVWSLGQEDPLKKEMATHCSTFAWEIHGQRRLEGYSPWGHNEHDWVTSPYLIHLLTIIKVSFLRPKYVIIASTFCDNRSFHKFSLAQFIIK